MPESQQKPLLNCVFRVLRIAQQKSRRPLESGDAGCEELVQLGVIHVYRENRRARSLQGGGAWLFNSQFASFGRWLKRLVAYARLNARMIPIYCHLFVFLRFS
jgi:hypothetical protein